MELIHTNPEGGHLGIGASIKREELLFHWPTLRKDLTDFIKNCEIC